MPKSLRNAEGWPCWRISYFTPDKKPEMLIVSAPTATAARGKLRAIPMLKGSRIVIGRYFGSVHLETSRALHAPVRDA